MRGVSKRFPLARDFFGRPTTWRVAVDDVSLTVARGQTVGLVGESGSGKSTLARLILRLLPVSAGSVIFDKLDITRASAAEVRRFRKRAQIVFQDPFGSLDPRFKVDEIVAEGMGHLKLSGRAKRQRVAELLELVRLPRNAADRFPHEFSGGQRQRISIARALAVNPEFVIADEPVSALDVSMQSQVLNLMSELQSRLGLTYLFISHDMAVVRFMADRIAVMNLGKLVEEGPADEIFRSPKHSYTQTLLKSVPSLIRGLPSERARRHARASL
ncbi:MAG: ATP-binding cassette domain-containing protein [Candidatus Dormibacteraeota bacterium]|nr:ATP-binding cassette domain-containing protein [Candidatus Dormibacteraeota bacterium]